MGSGWAEKLGAPVLLETLALYSYLKMQKFQKLEKEYFSNWTDSKRILGPETDENEIQNCKSLEQNT